MHALHMEQTGGLRVDVEPRGETILRKSMGKFHAPLSPLSAHFVCKNTKSASRTRNGRNFNQRSCFFSLNLYHVVLSLPSPLLSMPTDASYPAFPIFAFIAFVLVLIPLPWHFQAWNSGTCLFMIWTAVGCLNLFINSIVWRNNAIDWAPIWCDICTCCRGFTCFSLSNSIIASRIIVGLAVAIPAASLCINRRLYKIASCQTVTITLAHVRFCRYPRCPRPL
jgi:hypothetical protein